MTVFQKPMGAEQVLEEYLVIGHIDGLSIVQSAMGDKYYLHGELPVGTYVERTGLNSVYTLPAEQRRRILQEF